MVQRVCHKWEKWIFILLVSIQLLVCIWMGHEKRGFFCDEIYSYGLSNSEDYTFLDYQTSKLYGADTGGGSTRVILKIMSKLIAMIRSHLQRPFAIR